jgi:hypothetical protein
MNQLPPSPGVFHEDRFGKFAKIFASQGAPPASTTLVADLPPVSMTPAAKLLLVNFSTNFASVVDTGGKFATSVNDAGGKLPQLPTTPAANLPPVSTRHRWQIMGTISGCRHLKLNL